MKTIIAIIVTTALTSTIGYLTGVKIYKIQEMRKQRKIKIQQAQRKIDKERTKK